MLRDECLYYLIFSIIFNSPNIFATRYHYFVAQRGLERWKLLRRPKFWCISIFSTSVRCLLHVPLHSPNTASLGESLLHVNILITQRNWLSVKKFRTLVQLTPNVNIWNTKMNLTNNPLSSHFSLFLHYPIKSLSLNFLNLWKLYNSCKHTLEPNSEVELWIKKNKKLR